MVNNSSCHWTSHWDVIISQSDTSFSHCFEICQIICHIESKFMSHSHFLDKIIAYPPHLSLSVAKCYHSAIPYFFYWVTAVLELKSYWLTILLAVSLGLRKGGRLSEMGIKVFIFFPSESRIRRGSPFCRWLNYVSTFANTFSRINIQGFFFFFFFWRKWYTDEDCAFPFFFLKHKSESLLCS